MGTTTISYEEQYPMECGECRRQFTAHVRRIIDLAERPESLGEITDGRLWLQTCPVDCRTWAIMPLLVHDPISEHVVLIVPNDPIRLSQAEENRHADELMTILRRRLPSDIPMGWRNQLSFSAQPAGLPVVLGCESPSELLPTKAFGHDLDEICERVKRNELWNAFRAYDAATEAAAENRRVAVEAALSLLKPMIRQPGKYERHEQANL